MYHHHKHWCSQSCVLSPVLFVLYTNDLCNYRNDVKILKYADADITVIVGLISNNHEYNYHKCISDVKTWCDENNLDLNESKTKEVVFDFRTMYKNEKNEC